MQKIREHVADIQNSEMIIRIQKLGKLGENISNLISSLKIRRAELNYRKVAEILMEIIQSLDTYYDYSKTEEQEVNYKKTVEHVDVYLRRTLMHQLSQSLNALFKFAYELRK